MFNKLKLFHRAMRVPFQPQCMESDHEQPDATADKIEVHGGLDKPVDLTIPPSERTPFSNMRKH